MIYKILFISVTLILSFQVFLTKNKAKNSNDFLLAGKNLSYFGVAGVIIGTLVGGASTLGTVQMAYFYGLAGVIFTLGSGIACIILGLILTDKLYVSNITTITEFLGRYIGQRFRKISSFFSTLGIYIHIIAQIIASGAIISHFFGLKLINGSFISSLIILLYSVYGGVKGSSVIGKIKIFVIYIVMLVCFFEAFKAGGLYIFDSLPDNINWFSLFSYGKKKATFDLIFMIIGVLSTQVYLQAIFSAKSKKDAVWGSILSAALIPPVGFLGVYIGMYVRASGFVTKTGAEVFPYFINSHFSPLITSIILSFILFIVLGTASGLVVGVTTNIYKDFISKLKIKNEISAIRLINLTVVSSSYLIVALGFESKILKWSYLSMGIRGSIVFLPLIAALYLNEKIDLRKIEIFFYITFAAIIFYMI
ncbi:MAG: solute:Na+ symporter, family [Deferribacteres bacterium]|jgi:SSS family solute:Na+ symporter|nr:solute:Na+ symporter, family [Deferribacteres bacterium]